MKKTSQNRTVKTDVNTIDGKVFEVPVEGSLGLLALGFRGLIAWREKRDAARYSMKEHLFIPKPKKEKNVQKNR